MKPWESEIKRYTASREWFNIVGEWPLSHFYMDVRAESTILQNLCITFEAEYAKAFLQNIKCPANWWEAVKERWAPAWFKARWPVQYNEVPQYAICPYGKEEKGQCLNWMAAVIEHGSAPFQELHKLEGLKLCGMNVFVEADHPRRAYMAKIKLQQIIEDRHAYFMPHETEELDGILKETNTKR
jgi:hypothetical protein